MTRDSVLDGLGDVTAATITSTVRGIPSEVVLTEADGMPSVCVVNLDHVVTVQKAKLGALITTLGLAKMEQVRAALLFALGFDPGTQSH